MNLTEFVTARLDDVEAAAKAVAPLGYVTDMGASRLDERFSHGRIRFASEDGRSRTESDPAASRHFAHHDPARVLREVTAMRTILSMDSSTDSNSEWSGFADAQFTAISALADIWSDHPDYGEARNF